MAPLFEYFYSQISVPQSNDDRFQKCTKYVISMFSNGNKISWHWSHRCKKRKKGLGSGIKWILEKENHKRTRMTYMNHHIKNKRTILLGLLLQDFCQIFFFQDLQTFCLSQHEFLSFFLSIQTGTYRWKLHVLPDTDTDTHTISLPTYNLTANLTHDLDLLHLRRRTILHTMT